MHNKTHFDLQKLLTLKAGATVHVGKPRHTRVAQSCVVFFANYVKVLFLTSLIFFPAHTMGPKKARASKRKTEVDEEAERDDTREIEGRKRRKHRGDKKYIGAHVKIQGEVLAAPLSHETTTAYHTCALLQPPGGIWKAVQSSVEMGGNCFALFLGSQRSWKRPALDQEAAAKFRELCSLQGFDPAHIVPHGSYLMNCGSPKEGLPHTHTERLSPSCPRPALVVTVPLNLIASRYSLLWWFVFHSDVFQKSQDLLVDELSRCSLLGLNLFNLHPGSSLGSITTEQCCKKIAGAIDHAHRQTPTVVTGTRGG